MDGRENTMGMLTPLQLLPKAPLSVLNAERTEYPETVFNNSIKPMVSEELIKVSRCNWWRAYLPFKPVLIDHNNIRSQILTKLNARNEPQITPSQHHRKRISRKKQQQKIESIINDLTWPDFWRIWIITKRTFIKMVFAIYRDVCRRKIHILWWLRKLFLKQTKKPGRLHKRVVEITRAFIIEC